MWMAYIPQLPKIPVCIISERLQIKLHCLVLILCAFMGNYTCADGLDNKITNFTLVYLVSCS